MPINLNKSNNGFAPMSQKSKDLVKVDGQALADAVNKRLGTSYSRQYIASMMSTGLGHPAVRAIAIEEETRILREFLETFQAEQAQT